MMNLVLSFLLTLHGQVFAKENHAKDLKAQAEKTIACRVAPTAKTDATTLYNSVSCYQDKFSKKLATKEQAGMAYWFNSLKAVEKIWSCDGKEYQLKTYHSYTPHFICVNIKDADGESGTRLIFFEKENKTFKISSIYKPIKW